MVDKFSSVTEYLSLLPSDSTSISPVPFRRFICQVRAWEEISDREAKSVCRIAGSPRRIAIIFLAVPFLRAEMTSMSVSLNLPDSKYLLYRLSRREVR